MNKNNNDLQSYLTEQSLMTSLKMLFPKSSWIHNKPYLGRFRPDYLSSRDKIIVEFDGYSHYTQAHRIVLDEEKDELYSDAGFDIVRIPYFVQLSNETLNVLFPGRNFNIEQTYPHGFIDDKCVLPCDFCELGIRKFIHDLERFKCIYDDIIQSLKLKFEKTHDQRTVVPMSLLHLIEN